LIRCRHEIIRDVLKACLREEKNLTSLQRKANISSPTSNKVLEHMKRCGLIVERREKNASGKRYPIRFFRITNKGKNYLECFQKISEMIEKDVVA